MASAQLRNHVVRIVAVALGVGSAYWLTRTQSDAETTLLLLTAAAAALVFGAWRGWRAVAWALIWQLVVAVLITVLGQPGDRCTFGRCSNASGLSTGLGVLAIVGTLPVFLAAALGAGGRVLVRGRVRRTQPR